MSDLNRMRDRLAKEHAEIWRCPIGEDDLENAFKEGWDAFGDRLSRCEALIRGIAYLGYNGSPFQDKERRELQAEIARWAWEEFEKIFNKSP